MKNAILMLSFALVLSVPSPTAAQPADGQPPATIPPPSAKEVAEKVEQTKAIQSKVEQAQPNASRFVRTLTNVQIELTLSDQTGTGPSDKKSVSMVVSSGSWGRIRSAGNLSSVGDAPAVVDLNVDARPFVSVDGPIQLELTIVYAPARQAATEREPAVAQPIRVNQSLTVILQSGKPLVVSQAADPVSDRKVVVEVKATVLK